MSLRDIYEIIIKEYNLTLSVPESEECGDLEKLMEEKGWDEFRVEAKIRKCMHLCKGAHRKPEIDNQCLEYATARVCKALYNEK